MNKNDEDGSFGLYTLGPVDSRLTYVYKQE